MKVEVWKSDYLRKGDPYPMGIRLFAENVEEKRVLMRFYRGGTNSNQVTGNGDQLLCTFKDLVGFTEPWNDPNAPLEERGRIAAERLGLARGKVPVRAVPAESPVNGEITED